MKTLIIVKHKTRGGHEPFLALALGLRARGHEVSLRLTPAWVGWFERHGFACTQVLGSDIQELPHVTEQGAAADLIVSHGFAVVQPTVAERLGKPYVHVLWTPFSVPSNEAPPPWYGWLGATWPKPVNWAAWQAFKLLSQPRVVAHLNRVRGAAGLPPVPFPRLGPVLPFWARANLALVASDPAVAPMPADARGGARQIGYLFVPEEAFPPEEQLLPAELEQFLDAGPPPICFAFWSEWLAAGDENLNRLISIVFDATRQVGCRAVLRLRKPISAVPAHCFVSTGPLSFNKLMRRVSGLVHHGGAGSVGFAARAGVPQMAIYTSVIDRQYNGLCIKRAGLGPKPIKMERLTSDRLVVALTEMLESDTVKANVRRVSEQVARRDGVGAAVTLIESLFRVES